MQKNAPKKYKKMQKIHRNCKNHTKFAKYDVSGITDILPGVSPYWLSPITSFHHIGDNRYDRDILELCVLLLQDLCNRSQGLRCVFITAGPSTKLSYMGGGDMGGHVLRVCFITAGPITKLCAWGKEESGGHVL
jgi:hypothetical protein